MKLSIRLATLVLAVLLCIGTLAACGMNTGSNAGTTAADTTAGDTVDGETTVPDTAESDTTESDTTGDEFPEEILREVITIEKALELCGEPGNLTTERYYLMGTVVSIDNAAYGAMTIRDETGTISVYGTYSEDGSIGYAEMEDKPYKGDIVLLYCTLQNYNGTKEVKNARLIAFQHVEVEVDEKAYTEMSIAEAREADVGTKAKVDGVIARITYANGQIPMGVFLVDDTQSIYVYDGDLAARVKIGDTVTILGSKAYWVLDTEQNNAEKFGYKGCCQLEDVTLVKQEDTKADFNKSWIPTSTVKEILETPVTENITTTIYKVNALVSKQEGKGFTNYYFYDLDGKTGAYTYTQCNGSDFAWLDEFDGKICTVYLSALNAKSTSSDCFFRFVPVSVLDEGFTFNTDETPAHAVTYYGLPQFNATYTGDPAAEMITSVSSELLGFENATLSYASSNESVIKFTEENGKVIFHCAGTGTATVTVTGSYNGKTASETVEIKVTVNASYDTVSVSDAQKAEVGEIVTVKGIIGPSLVNRAGFYFFDGTGMIAVVVKDEAIFDEIEIGHEIVLTGKRDLFRKDGKTHAGQLCITNAEVLANYYGSHDYPTDGFITDKTLADVYNLNVNDQHSTEVYVVKATVILEETAYYSNIKLTDGTNNLTLYSSGSGQYAFLKDYVGQEVTVELAPCNWNDKSYYAGCVLAVYTEDGKIVNSLNFNH